MLALGQQQQQQQQQPGDDEEEQENASNPTPAGGDPDNWRAFCAPFAPQQVRHDEDDLRREHLWAADATPVTRTDARDANDNDDYPDSPQNGWERGGAALRRRLSKPACLYKHVPHREKPPQIVARRNARERRRVQAVNGAFMKLRKAIPIENARGKRISKVKTLQYAIEYINRLQRLLEENRSFYHFNLFPGCSPDDYHLLEDEM